MNIYQYDRQFRENQIFEKFINPVSGSFWCTNLVSVAVSQQVVAVLKDVSR